MLLIAVGMAKQMSYLSLWVFIASTRIKSLFICTSAGTKDPRNLLCYALHEQSQKRFLAMRNLQTDYMMTHQGMGKNSRN